MEGTRKADEGREDEGRAPQSASGQDHGDEASEITQADTRPSEPPESSSSEGGSGPARESEPKRAAPRPSSVPSKPTIASPSKPPPFPSARPSRGPLPPPPERPHPPTPSAAPPKVEPSPSASPPRVESIPSELAHAVAAPDLKDATEPEPEGPPIQTIASLPAREFELMKSELERLKAQSQRQGLVRTAVPYLVLALGAVTVGYLLGDSTAAKRRSEVRKAAMERYFSSQSPTVDQQKDALAFIQKELAPEDPELKRWAETQVSVIDERMAARTEREAALKGELLARGEELAQVQGELSRLEAENKALGEKILAFEAVAKKLEQLKLANIVLIQTKASVERLSKRLTEVEESPEAKRLAE